MWPRSCSGDHSDERTDDYYKGRSAAQFEYLLLDWGLPDDDNVTSVAEAFSFYLPSLCGRQLNMASKIFTDFSKSALLGAQRKREMTMMLKSTILFLVF